MMGTRRHIRVRAHAKLNLALRVKGARPDGYHELETVFQSLALHDTLVCTLRRGPLALGCDDPQVPVDSRNLVWRAARHLWRALGRAGEPHGVAITIAKQIPMQAGLGGGSADAAAALVALPACAVVLALPAFGVSTADAYGWLDADRAAAARRRATSSSRSAFSLRGWPARTLVVSNDLEAPVARRHPEIARLRDLLASAGAMAAAMTGSGAAVFGLFESPLAARHAARSVAQAGAISLLTRTIDRRACLRALQAPPR